MSELPALEELLRRKAIEAGDLERRRLRREEADRDLEAARAHYWELLDEFVERARELSVSPRTWTPPAPDGYTPWIVWIEGYPLANGSVLTAPPLRYCSAERRKVRRPRPTVVPVEELTLFVPSEQTRPGTASGGFDLHTVSGGEWPRIQRLEHAATIITGVQRRLEASLLALMD